ncbi:MAG: 50S ribosomal protein L31 [Chloroflexi bacterium]|nr:50S ribosomal protein L31 [Chloroflexota bacterium]
MKKDIHPKYYPKAKVICACGNTWTTGSTQEVIHTEMCSACHPFFTGEQRIVDTAGQVERFQRRKEVADRIAEEAARRRMEKQAKEESIFEFVPEEGKEAVEEALPAEQAAVAEEKPKGKRGGKERQSKGRTEAAPKAAGRKKPAQDAKKARAKVESKSSAEPASE